MNPLQRMELHKADFTQNDQIIYDCIMKNPAGITHMSTSSLAELCGVSQPALSGRTDWHGSTADRASRAGAGTSFVL